MGGTRNGLGPGPRWLSRPLARWIVAGILVLVGLPLFFVADSYLIVHDVRPLARETPGETRVMRDRLSDPRTPRPLRQRWVGLGAISPHLVHAVVVHEDATFFEHRGFDTFEIRAALRRSWSERRMVRGASTITTQLARNLYLGTGRSLLRKIREIPLTIRLEGALEKKRILEIYLNVVEWGPGVFGAEAASRYHYNTSARNLTPTQAALLAAALPSPRRSTPARPSPYLRERAAIILARMQARGWLDSGQLEAARRSLGVAAPGRGDAPPLREIEPEPAPGAQPAEGISPAREPQPAEEPQSPVEPGPAPASPRPAGPESP